MDIDLNVNDTNITTSGEIGTSNSRSLLLRHKVENWANANKLPLNDTKMKSMLATGKRL